MLLSISLAGVLTTIFLSACSVLLPQPAPASSLLTPTVNWIFSRPEQNGSAQATPAIPIVADLFQPTATEPPATIQATSGISLTTATPTPAQETVNPYLRITLTPTPGLTSRAEPGTGEVTPESTPALSATIQSSTPQPDQDRLAGATQFKLQYIYQDALASGWETTNSWGVQYDLNETDFVHQGTSGVAVTPQEDYGALFFNRYPGNPNPILRDDVAGVAFWINPGKEQLFPGDLSVTLIGSNQFPYYIKGDTSVKLDDKKQFFSETRLSLLDFRNALQPDNWYQVILWVDDLPFDPAYKYVTSFYIKNDAGVRQTFYIDDLSLILYAN
jgi:hypothetical protein